MISVLSCHALGNGDVCHGPSAGTHEDEKPILLVLCTQYHANTVSWPDLFFHLAKLKKKGNMHETNTLRVSPLHVLATIKSALVVSYISGTIFLH